MIDPTATRISEHFLLSDFLFCHSMAVFGHKNVFLDPKNTKIREISHLCSTILEPILEEKGPISVSYGHISDELSHKIVKYQDPKKPSYHRWDWGAAVDICVHDHVLQGQEGAPITLAFGIDEKYDYSRMITYSESPFVCIATRLSEKNNGARRAFYENQYQGTPKVKPKYITYPDNPKTRERLASAHTLPCDWRGAGYPTYHGGGIRQAQHVRLGRYATLLDFLYSTQCVNEGVKNNPTPDVETRRRFFHAGKTFSELLTLSGCKRLSIVRAFESHLTFDESPYNWQEGFMFQVIPPEGVNPNEIADIAAELEFVHSVAANKATRRVTIAGK